jgi:hypothetical protein
MTPDNMKTMMRKFDSLWNAIWPGRAGCIAVRGILAMVGVWMVAGVMPAQEDKKAPPPTPPSSGGSNAAIDGVKGVKQEAVSSVKNEAPPTVVPITPPPPPPPDTPTAVNKVDGVDTINGVKTKGREAVQPVPPPPPTGSATEVGGGAVGAVSSIRAVKGVQGIIPPKQLNLEAALLIKQDGANTPAGTGAEGGKGKAAAAALLTAPGGRVPPRPQPNADGRAALQEFEKLNTPGS